VRGSKKNELKPWKVKGWVIPMEKSSEFVANMERVLNIYKRPYDPTNPVICMDESPKQLISEVRPRQKMKPVRESRVDYEYIRHGVVKVFLANEPLRGKRFTHISEFKTIKEWVLFIKMVSTKCSKTKKITLVMHNYITHVVASFYKKIETREAKKLWDRSNLYTLQSTEFCLTWQK